MADRQPGGEPALLGAGGERRLDGGRGAADHRLCRGVDVGQHHVARRGIDHLLHFIERSEHRSHHAAVDHVDVGHLASASAHGLERRVEVEPAGGDERAVLAEAVADDHVGFDAVGSQQFGEGEVGGEHGRLGDLGLTEILLGRGHGSGVVAVDEHVRAEWLGQHRCHHPIGVVEGASDDRFDLAEVAEHVDVLRALTRVHERDRQCRTRPTEHAAAAQQRPTGRLGEGGDRLRELVGQFGGVAVIDGDAFGRREIGAAGRARSRRVACGGGGVSDAQTLDEVGLGGRTDHQRAAQWCLRFRHRGDGRCRRGHRNRRRCRTEIRADGDELRLAVPEAAGHVLFHHDVEVGATEAEGADTRGTNAACGHVP